MNLDALREQWAEHDRKLEESLRLNRQLLAARRVDGTRSALQRHVLGLSIEGCITLVALLLLGSFIHEHITRLRFALPAMHLSLVAVAFLIDLIRQIVAARHIEYGRPITVLQRQLEQLRVMRIRHQQGVLLWSLLAWTPFLIVVLEGVWGVDAYRVFGLVWLGVNLLLGVVAIPLAIGLSRRFGKRFDGSPALQGLMNDLAGSHLEAARKFLDSLTEFEVEAEAS